MPVSANLYYSQYCERKTEYPPLVLIHGAGGTHLYWPVEIRRMSGCCIYAIDLPGHGKSSMIDGQQTIGEYARYLVQWLQSMHLRRAVLVGHSMGCAIALAMAIHHPTYVVGLALIGGGARLRVHPDLLSSTNDPTTFHKAVELLISYSFSQNTETRLIDMASRRLHETRQSVIYGDLLACDRFDVMHSLNSILQPALVICGADDQMTPVRYSQYLASHIPNSRLRIIPGAGHMVMLEKPHLVADNLLSFVNEVSFRPGEVI